MPEGRSARTTNPSHLCRWQVSVATATLPLAGGFIGIIPALGMLDPPVTLTLGQQLLWALALTYFGVCVAVPLRRQASRRARPPLLGCG